MNNCEHPFSPAHLCGRIRELSEKTDTRNYEASCIKQIANVLPTCDDKVHSAVRSFDVFLCAILTAQTPCFTFAAFLAADMDFDAEAKRLGVSRATAHRMHPAAAQSSKDRQAADEIFLETY